MAQLNWDKKVQATFEKILGVIPEMLREAVKPKLVDFIKTKAGESGVVTESLLIAAIQEMKPPEPYMSQIMKVLARDTDVDLNKVDNILSKYQRRQEKLLSVFHELQKEYGYLPKEAISKASGYLNIPLSVAYRVASSCQAFALEPKEKHLVKVCDGIACHLRHSDKLYGELKVISAGRFALEKVKCLGCCGLTSMVMVDEEFGDSKWAKEKVTKF